MAQNIVLPNANDKVTSDRVNVEEFYEVSSKERNGTFNLIVGAQPSFSFISVLSELRPRTPSGPGMCWTASFLSSKLRTISAISFMLTISSLPMFTGSRKSDFVNLYKE